MKTRSGKAWQKVESHHSTEFLVEHGKSWLSLGTLDLRLISKIKMSEENFPKTDEQVQDNRARDIAAERYYRKTWNFTVPGLREDLEEALQEIDQLASRQDETLNSLGMVDWITIRYLSLSIFPLPLDKGDCLLLNVNYL